MVLSLEDNSENGLAVIFLLFLALTGRGFIAGGLLYTGGSSHGGECPFFVRNDCGVSVNSSVQRPFSPLM